MYVWQPELTAALNPELLKAKNIDALDDAVFAQTASFLADTHADSISKIMLPYRGQQTISIQFKNGKTKYYHPENGRFLGNASASIVFFEKLLEFHRTLFIPKIGKYVTGTSTLVFLLMILASGIYIWSKNYGSNLKEGFRLKWNSKRKKFNFDLHKVLGIGFFVPLLIIAFTGAYFTYNSYYKKALSILDRERVAPSKQTATITSFNEALLHSDESYALWAIYYPQNANEDYRFRYIKNRYIVPGLRKTKEQILITDHGMTTLADYGNSTLSNRIAAQFYPIHIGEIAGTFGRILVFISGLVPITLYITGIRIYLSKKRRRKRKSK